MRLQRLLVLFCSVTVAVSFAPWAQALVACLGLLPAALSTGIGSDTQRPFAIVIVAGLISRLFLGFFVNPVLYEMVAREGDVLQV
jgi:heavy metal efflux system protein